MKAELLERRGKTRSSGRSTANSQVSAGEAAVVGFFCGLSYQRLNRGFESSFSEVSVQVAVRQEEVER